MRGLFFLAALAGFVYFGVSFYNQRKQEISLSIPDGYAPAAKVVESSWQQKIADIAKTEAEVEAVEESRPSQPQIPPAFDTTKPLLPMASLEEPEGVKQAKVRPIAPKLNPVVQRRAHRAGRVVSDMSHHLIAHRHRYHHRRRTHFTRH